MFNSSKAVHVKFVVEHGRQGFVKKGVNRLVAFAEDDGVIGIGGHAFQSVGQQLAQAADIVIQLRVGHDADHGALFQQPLHGPGRDELDRLGQLAGERPVVLFGEAPMEFFLQGLLQAIGLIDPALQALWVEIDVGHGGEQGFDDEAVRALVDVAELAQPMAQEAKALQLMQQQVLQQGNFGTLAADADASAGLRVAGLFALIAKHVHG